MTVQFSEPKSESSTADSSHQISQPHLAKQDAATVDPSKLTALSPEVVRSLNYFWLTSSKIFRAKYLTLF